MRQSRTNVRQEQIEWRRDKVLELAANGYSIREIESTLKISHATIHRDLVLLKEQAKEHINYDLVLRFNLLNRLHYLEHILHFQNLVRNGIRQGIIMFLNKSTCWSWCRNGRFLVAE